MPHLKPLLLLLFLVLGGCNKTVEPSFQAFSVSVIDDKTLVPIAGAKILTPCMGLSPYRTNSYVSDASGKARVMYYSGHLVVNVSAAGYNNSGMTFMTNEIAVVKLKRMSEALTTPLHAPPR